MKVNVKQCLIEKLKSEIYYKPLSNINKIDDFNYIITESDIIIKLEFRLESKPINLHFVKSNLIDTYYNLILSISDTKNINIIIIEQLKATIYKILYNVISKYKPKLITFDGEPILNGIYFDFDFKSVLKNLFPDYNTIILDYSTEKFMVNKMFTKLKEKSIKKTMEHCDTITLADCIKIYYYPHKNKHFFKGIKQNDLRKEQLERIKNKLKYLF